MMTKIIQIIALCLLSGSLSVAQQKIHEIPEFDDIFISDSLPQYYDLRNYNRLSPVKVQSTGGCWSSAAISSIESVFRTFRVESQGLSDINLKLFHGFEPERSNNGNHYMATAYLTRASGPVIKNTESDSIKYELAPINHYISGARYLPNDPKLIKQSIINYGSVFSMMYFKRSELDSISNVYYTKKISINHAVNLVGWNDTLITSSGRGVWIAQNSLGEKLGEQGFFFIPYEDENILKNNAIWPDWFTVDSLSRILYYDTLGSYQSYGFGDSICYGLIKFVTKEDILIDKIGTSINHPNTKVYAEFFDDFDLNSKELSNSLSYSKGINCTYPGYYTLNMEVPVKISANDPFYVMVMYNTPNDTLPLPVESKIIGYSNPHITSDRCWVNPNYEKWPTTWYKCGSNSKYESLHFDLSIKVYAKKMIE